MIIEPGFSASRLSLLDRGFIYAIAHIRGGDDLGYHWYEDGKLDKRTNTFNDFSPQRPMHWLPGSANLAGWPVVAWMNWMACHSI